MSLACGAHLREAWKPVGLLALAVLLAGCEANTAPAPKAERPVQIQEVKFGSENQTREFVGIVRARYETDLGFRVAGKITERLVNVGDNVRKGDIVARLDPQDLRLQVESAEAEFAAAQSNLAQTSVELDRYHPRSRRAASPRPPTLIARPLRMTKPKAGSSAPSARSTSPATSLAMPSSRPTRTAS